MYMLTTFSGRARLTCPSWKHGVNEGAKSTAKPAPYFFLHARQSSKIQSTHRNGAHRRKACELVVLSIAEKLALGAMVSVSGGPEHASPPEVLMREIHLYSRSTGRLGGTRVAHFEIKSRYWHPPPSVILWLQSLCVFMAGVRHKSSTLFQSEIARDRGPEALGPFTFRACSPSEWHISE